jgi:gas vesicle protein
MMSTFSDSVTYQSRASFSALSALEYRLSVLADHNVSVKATSKKVSALERLKSSTSIKAERVDAMSSELLQVKRKENETRETLRATSEEVKREVTAYEEDRDRELMVLMGAYIKKQAGVEGNLLKIWKGIERDLSPTVGSV